MKQVMAFAAILILVVLACEAVFGQVRANKFKVLGTDSEGVTYAIRLDNMKVMEKSGEVRFDGLLYLSDSNYHLTRFLINCDTKEFKIVGEYGQKKGEEFDREVKDVPFKKANPDLVIYAAIKYVCTELYGQEAEE